MWACVEGKGCRFARKASGMQLLTSWCRKIPCNFKWEVCLKKTEQSLIYLEI